MQEVMGNYEDMFPPMNNLKLKTMKTMEESDKRKISLLSLGYKPKVPQPGYEGKQDFVHIQGSPVIYEEKVSHKHK